LIAREGFLIVAEELVLLAGEVLDLRLSLLDRKGAHEVVERLASFVLNQVNGGDAVGGMIGLRVPFEGLDVVLKGEGVALSGVLQLGLLVVISPAGRAGV